MAQRDIAGRTAQIVADIRRWGIPTQATHADGEWVAVAHANGTEAYRVLVQRRVRWGERVWVGTKMRLPNGTELAWYAMVARRYAGYPQDGDEWWQ